MADEIRAGGPLCVTDCPECGTPAEVTNEGTVASTDGLVAMVRTLCVRRHWFLLPVDRLPTATYVQAALLS